MAALVTLAVLVLLPAVFKSDETCCADSWVPYGGSCYLFHDEGDEKIDWLEAINYCKLHNSELVTIETSNENKFIKWYATKLFKSYDDRQHQSFWLGASDSDIEGIWKWFATDQEMTWADWDTALQQPRVDIGNAEDCLALNGAYNFTWHDGKCRERVGYPLCERRTAGVGIQIVG